MKTGLLAAALSCAFVFLLSGEAVAKVGANALARDNRINMDFSGWQLCAVLLFSLRHRPLIGPKFSAPKLSAGISRGWATEL